MCPCGSVVDIYIYIYIYAFSRRFYPKRLTVQCIQVTVSTFYQLLLSLGIEPMILALLTPCSTSWATFTFTFSHLADAFIQSDLQLGNT